MQETGVSGSGSKTLSSSNTGDLTGTEILNRRSRKDRAADREKTFSSGSTNSIKKISKPSFNGFEYNQNQFQSMYSTDLFQGEEEIDLESQQPYSNQHKESNLYATNNSNFVNDWEQGEYDGIEETVLPVHHKNHLFDPSNNMQNIAFKQRQNLMSKGLKSFEDKSDGSFNMKDYQNYSLAFKFIKTLNSFKSLEHIQKETNEKDLTASMQSYMHKAFYQYLAQQRQQACDQAVLNSDDENPQPIILEEKKEVTPDAVKKKKSTNKKARQKKNKALAALKREEEQKAEALIQQTAEQEKDNVKRAADNMLQGLTEPIRSMKVRDISDDTLDAFIASGMDGNNNPLTTVTLAKLKQREDKFDQILPKYSQKPVPSLVYAPKAVISVNQSVLEQLAGGDKGQGHGVQHTPALSSIIRSRVKSPVTTPTKPKESPRSPAVQSPKSSVKQLNYSPTSGSEDSSKFLEYQLQHLQNVYHKQSEIDLQEDQLEQWLQDSQNVTNGNYDGLGPKIAEHLKKEKKSISNTVLCLDLLAEYMSDDDQELPMMVTPNKKVIDVVREARQVVRMEKEHQLMQQQEIKPKSKQYCEERTGLLTNEVHHDKYVDVPLSDDCNSSDEDNARFKVGLDSYILGGRDVSCKKGVDQEKKVNDRMDQLEYILRKRELIPKEETSEVYYSDFDQDQEERPPYLDRMPEWDAKPLTLSQDLIAVSQQILGITGGSMDSPQANGVALNSIIGTQHYPTDFINRHTDPVLSQYKSEIQSEIINCENEVRMISTQIMAPRINVQIPKNRPSDLKPDYTAMTDQSGGERTEDKDSQNEQPLGEKKIIKNAKKRRHKRAKAQADAEKKKQEITCIDQEDLPDRYEVQFEDLPVQKVEKQVTRVTGNLNNPQFVKELYSDNTLYNQTIPNSVMRFPDINDPANNTESLNRMNLLIEQQHHTTSERPTRENTEALLRKINKMRDLDEYQLEEVILPETRPEDCEDYTSQQNKAPLRDSFFSSSDQKKQKMQEQAAKIQTTIVPLSGWESFKNSITPKEELSVEPEDKKELPELTNFTDQMTARIVEQTINEATEAKKLLPKDLKANPVKGGKGGKAVKAVAPVIEISKTQRKKNRKQAKEEQKLLDETEKQKKQLVQKELMSQIDDLKSFAQDNHKYNYFSEDSPVEEKKAETPTKVQMVTPEKKIIHPRMPLLEDLEVERKEQKKKEPVKHKPKDQKKAQKLLRLAQTESKLSSTLSGRSNFSDTVSVHCPTPVEIIKNRRPGTSQRVTPFFKEDLQQRDRRGNLQIPKRGTSASSYGKEEKEHQQIVNDLDELFDSPGKKEDSSKKKASASLVTANRNGASTLNKDVIQDSKPVLLIDLSTSIVDDLDSPTGSKPKDKKQVGLSKQIETEVKKSKSSTKVEPPPSPMKYQEKVDPLRVQPPKLSKNQKKQENKKKQEQAQVVKISNQKPHEVKEKEVVKQEPKPEVKDTKDKVSQPKEPQQKKKQDQKGQNNQPKGKQAADTKQSKNKQTPKQPAQVKPQNPAAKPQSFSNWDTMFQTVYGAGQGPKPPTKKETEKSENKDRSSSAKKKEQKVAKETKTETPAKSNLKVPLIDKSKSRDNSVRSSETEIKINNKKKPSEKQQSKQPAAKPVVAPAPDVNEEQDTEHYKAHKQHLSKKEEAKDEEAKSSVQIDTQVVNYGPNMVASGAQVSMPPPTNQKITGFNQRQMNHTFSSNFPQKTQSGYYQNRPPVQYQQQTAIHTQQRGYGTIFTPNQTVFIKQSEDTQHIEKKVFSQQTQQFEPVTQTQSTESKTKTQSSEMVTSAVNTASSLNDTVPTTHVTTTAGTSSTKQEWNNTNTTNNTTVNYNVNVHPVMQQQMSGMQYPSQNQFNNFQMQMPMYNNNNNQNPQYYNQQQQQQAYMQMMPIPANAQAQVSQAQYRGQTNLMGPMLNTNSQQAQVNSQGYQQYPQPYMMLPNQMGFNQQLINQNQGQHPQQLNHHPVSKPVLPQANPSFVVDNQLANMVNGKLQLLQKVNLDRFQSNKTRGPQQSIEIHQGQGVESKFQREIGVQIRQFSQKIERMIADAEPKRTQVYELLQQISKDTFSGKKLEFDIYGSMATGLAIDSSDLDIAVSGAFECGPIDEKKNMINALSALNNNLEGLEYIKSKQFISSAMVPVIKLLIDFDKLQNSTKSTDATAIKLINVDIIFISPAMGEEKKEKFQSQLCAEFIVTQMQDHPFLAPLTIVLKKFIVLNGYNSPFQGTLSSYSLVLMIIAMLKDLRKKHGAGFETSQPGNVHLNLGKAFTTFLTFYGEQFRSQDTGIDGNHEYKQFYDCLGELETAQEDNNYDGMTPSLLIIDPIDAKNNVGKQSFDFKKVQELFNLTMLRMLVRFRDIYEKSDFGDLEKDIQRLNVGIDRKKKSTSEDRHDEQPPKITKKHYQQDHYRNGSPPYAQGEMDKPLEDLEKNLKQSKECLSQTKEQLTLMWKTLLNSILLIDNQLELKSNCLEDQELLKVQSTVQLLQQLCQQPQQNAQPYNGSMQSMNYNYYNNNYSQQHHQNNYGRQQQYGAGYQHHGQQPYYQQLNQQQMHPNHNQYGQKQQMLYQSQPYNMPSNYSPDASSQGEENKLDKSNKQD